MIKQIQNLGQQMITLVRAKDWWSYKLAPVLGTAYATAAISDISLILLWSTFLFLLVALVIGASYASLINNVCDQEEDKISGKANYFIGRSKFFIALAIIGCIVPGLIVSGLLIQMPLALCIYIGNWLLFTVYSVPPIRLKNRGFLGVLAIAVGEGLVPQILAILLIAHNTDKPLSATWLTMIAIWSFALGCRSIIWHQILDFENDHLAGINTFAVNTSQQTLERIAKLIVFPIEFLSLLAAILMFANNVFNWIFICIYLVTESLRYYFWKIDIVVIKPSHNHRLFLFEYYDFFYPLGFLVFASCKDYGNLIIFGFHLLLYHQRLWWWMKDFWGLLRWDINKLLNHNNYVKL